MKSDDDSWTPEDAQKILSMDSVSIQGAIPSSPPTDFWFHYYVERLKVAVEDQAVSDLQLRRWIEEFVEDLSELVQQTFPIWDYRHEEATQLAQAMQNFIFHDGPEPQNSREGRL